MTSHLGYQQLLPRLRPPALALPLQRTLSQHPGDQPAVELAQFQHAPTTALQQEGSFCTSCQSRPGVQQSLFECGRQLSPDLPLLLSFSLWEWLHVRW